MDDVMVLHGEYVLLYIFVCVDGNASCSFTSLDHKAR